MAKNTAIEVVLKRSNLTFVVPPDKSILQVLIEEGIDPLYDCQRGECGICQVAVLEDGLRYIEQRLVGDSFQCSVGSRSAASFRWHETVARRFLQTSITRDSAIEPSVDGRARWPPMPGEDSYFNIDISFCRREPAASPAFQTPLGRRGAGCMRIFLQQRELAAAQSFDQSIRPVDFRRTAGARGVACAHWSGIDSGSWLPRSAQRLRNPKRFISRGAAASRT